MSLNRREFLQMLAAATAGLGMSPAHAAQVLGSSKAAAQLYDVPVFGNVSLLHFTDCHAQLLPIYFREPSVNLGLGKLRGNAPHLVGSHLLGAYQIRPGSPEAHAYTALDFAEAARRYGKVGGFAHLATLVHQVRSAREGRCLLLDGGDTWQGSATSLWTHGQDMVDACKLLGVDMMTAHWEFTYGHARVREIVEKDLAGKIEFLCQNVNDSTYDDLIFKPYAMRVMNGVKLAVIGQAFPYTPIANPRWMFPDWSFGIKEAQMQKTVDQARGAGAEVVILLSHNGMDVDLKMASRVRGIDAILGGHTHDAVPRLVPVRNGGGTTLVGNSGSNGKFLSVLDLDVKSGKVADFRYRLLPVFSNLLPADPEMAAYIEKARAPYADKLIEKLAVTEGLLYRRGNFNGTFDQLIVEAMMAVQGAEMAFSPGFRWGTSLLPGDTITMENLMDQTGITYAGTTLSDLSGETIKIILEDVADNLFHEDPYYQQGGDMVRVGGLTYTLDLTQKHGRRIQDLRIRGQAAAAHKHYKVAGWASIQEPTEARRPIWDVVAEYLKNQKSVRIGAPYLPKIKGAAGNPGIFTQTGNG